MPSIAVVTLETQCLVCDRAPPPHGHLQVLSVQLTTPSIGKMLVRIWVGSDCAYAPPPPAPSAWTRRFSSRISRGFSGQEIPEAARVGARRDWNPVLSAGLLGGAERCIVLCSVCVVSDSGSCAPPPLSP